jgi:NitT/TauT family transport system substrate-binding protein
MSTRIATSLLSLALLLAAPVRAETIQAGTTAGAESAPLFVAAHEGIFARHGLDIQPLIIPLMPNLPASLVSGSIGIGGMVSTTFLQAVSGGLDLVVISGGSVTSPTAQNIALIAGSNTNIHTAQDMIGHRVGMPGIGAFMHVTLRWWLTQQHIDWHKIEFTEVTFPTMRDLLRAGQVDAVGAIDPFARSIVDSGAGRVISYFLKDVPAGKPSVIYVATRAWAEAHAAQLPAFREAVMEAIEVIRADPDRGRAAIGAYIKLPPQVLAATELGTYDPAITAAGLSWWVDVMRTQDLISEPLDTVHLILR